MRSSSPIPAVATAVVVLVLYAGALWVLPIQVFWHPDSGSKYLTVDMVRFGGSPVVGYPGRSLDPELRFYPSRCGPIYPTANEDGSLRYHWPPWFSYAARPLYLAFGLTGAYLFPLLAGWLTAVLAGWIAWRSSPTLAPPTIVLVAVASPVAFYSVSFTEHTPATLLGVAAVAVGAILRPGRGAALAAMVALLVLSIVLRMEMMAFAVSLLLAWLLVALIAWVRKPPASAASPAAVRPRRLPPWVTAIGGLTGAVVAALVLINSIPERYHLYFKLLRSIWTAIRVRMPFFTKSLVDVFMTSIAQPGPLSEPWVHQAALIAAGVLLVTPFLRARRIEAVLTLFALVVLFQYGALTALGTRPYIASQGVLAAAPFIAVAVFALPAAWRSRDYALLLVTLTTLFYTVTGFLMLFVLRVALDGIYLIGLDGGVRYMLTLYPLATIAAVGGLAAYRASNRAQFVRSAFTVLTVALALVATQYQVRGLRSLYDNSSLLARWAAAAEKQSTIVTDVWWMPASLAQLFLDEPFYCVTQYDDLRSWIRLAAVAGVESFTYMTPSRVGADRLERLRMPITEESKEFVEGMWFYRYKLDASRMPPERDRKRE